MVYILRNFCFNCKLQKAVLIYGVLSSVFSGILMITAYSSNLFLDTVYYNHTVHHYTTPIFWIIVLASTVIMISSMFLAFGAKEGNDSMLLIPWLVVQAITLTPFIPIILAAIFCVAVISFPVYIWWTVYSLFVTLRTNTGQPRATAPSLSTLRVNDPNTNYVEIPLPAYGDIVPGGSTKSQTKIPSAKC